MPQQTAFRTPRERLAGLADDGRYLEHEVDTPSPYLARLGIEPQADDGVVAATLTIGGTVFEAVAQDARFLRGSVGARHGGKIAAAIARARAAGRPLLVLAASGGVRLHEANAAELALGRALRALCDARAAGMPALSIGVGDVFGGMSVFVAACDALALVPAVRFGLSGPRVIAAAGAVPFDADDREAVARVFGAAARAAQGWAEVVPDEPGAQRAWLGERLARCAADRVPFDERLRLAQARLAANAGAPPRAPRVVVDGTHATLGPFVGVVDAASLAAVDEALLALPAAAMALDIVEDSRGHAASVEAECLVLSRYLAHHALVLASLRRRGVSITGIVEGTGHSAAFFANALQADRVYAQPAARIVAMEPAALASVTGIDPAALAEAIEHDPLLGHPARHFAALGGLALVERREDVR